MQSHHTKHFIIHNYQNESVDNLIKHAQIQQAATFLRAGETVAFPTETVYGLGANALSDIATGKIFEAKGRPSDNPLIVHIAEQNQLVDIVDNIPPLAIKLMEHFWPGPLTLVLPKGKKVCKSVSAGLDTVAVRIPQHPIALALLKACQLPIAAPSANRSGRPSPTTAEHVLEDLSGKIAGVVDGGAAGVGLESTVVDVTGKVPMILRPGGVTMDQLRHVVGEVLVDPAITDSDQKHGDEAFIPKSPGVKYQHYAPKGQMWLVSEDFGLEKMRERLQALVKRDREAGYRVAVLTTDEGVDQYTADHVVSLGQRNNLDSVASKIYASLRTCDQMGIERIYAEAFPKSGVGMAIMNRLLKAADGKMLGTE
ncbi:L-threonylcarbamoyladenylate synthase [Bacillus horti]|uniref:Threonylcarbamoyl-AMP synthase n=1 Tax=Caldalkalibacillus horti TaxID=77523 RepID=A0ABT9VVW7_9BACI|nr:L-threonylcarbamoyladenylate synthase [Bacillus horti]MDQ0165141.1 L-threonylcarbamoyladenylate synthase [Bacillus horti]